MIKLNNNTPEGSYLRCIKTHKLATLKMDYPHKKILATTQGPLTVEPAQYCNWVQVEPIIDFDTGLQYMQELH